MIAQLDLLGYSPCVKAVDKCDEANPIIPNRRERPSQPQNVS